MTEKTHAMVSKIKQNKMGNIINITLHFSLAVPQVVAGGHIQGGKKVFSQPPIVQVLPPKKMREACNFHHRYVHFYDRQNEGKKM